MPDNNESTPAARPSVVVVIPFYNGADFIVRAFDAATKLPVIRGFWRRCRAAA